MTSVNEQIIERACRGVRPGLIARDLGVDRWKVYHVITVARRAGLDIPRFSLRGIKQEKRRVPLSPEAREALAPHAAARGLSPIDLAERLLIRIVQDDLVDAVLDDGGAHG